MLQKSFLDQLQKMIRSFFPDETQKIFVFGSSVREEKFRDIDVGFLGNPSVKKLSELQEFLEESTFPYLVDLVNFSKTSKDFSDFVLLSEKKYGFDENEKTAV